MAIVYTVVTAVLMIVSFMSGMTIANSYHRSARLQEDIAIRHYQEAVRQSYYATEAQRAYMAAQQPATHNETGIIDFEFAKRLHDNGRATKLYKGGQM